MASKAISLRSSGLAYSTLGRGFLHKGCGEDALLNLREAIEADPDSFIVWANLADALSQLDRAPGGGPLQRFGQLLSPGRLWRKRRIMRSPHRTTVLIWHVRDKDPKPFLISCRRNAMVHSTRAYCLRSRKDSIRRPIGPRHWAR